MESILEKLLADNNSIQEETKELREAFEDPGVISSLCNVLVSSSNPQVRQNAAVLLRKRLSKSQHWTRLSAEAKAGIKEGLIQVYVKEQEKVVKNAIVQLIGTIMKLESGKLGWPEMMECLKMWVNSSVLEEKFLGLFALSILAEVVPDVFMEQYPVALYFSQMLVQTLRMPDISASPLAHLTLVCLAHFAPPVQHDQIAALYTESIPTMLALIGDLAKNLRGNSALEAMQVIDKLLENNPAVLQPHLRLLVNFCLDIAFTRLPSITDEMRNKVFNTLSEVVRVKKRVIVCDDLVSPILRVVFELIGKIPAGSGDGGEEEKQEEYFVEYEDDSTPTTCAIQLLDTMALHLPPDKLLPLLMECVEPSVTSADPCARKAAYLSMAMVSERCADYVRTKHLEQFLRYVRQGITEQNTPVRNAALFALGQFSEHLQFYINMTESSTDKGHKVIDQLKSMSGIPNLSLFLLEARTYEELHNYIFVKNLTGFSS
ncbi:importin-4 [Nilaparvata lugens]|uniref:importin-4 n=1 Tax=Nilaparvata lugens TaxID=108931 RepID=UPI00193CACBF|nr:importin-4 [Nilaparvata lugens]XP_039286152.1 importin-4 [Nilaparvata lugens]XP_039286153.1 importin-4 [Nilaparvata lugens]